jgi:predicted Zn-dependent protease
MKKIAEGLLLLFIFLVLSCEKNPFTEKSTLAFVGNDSLFAQSFAEYENFLSDSVVITGTPDAVKVEQVGNELRLAAEKWLAAKGYEDYLDDYQWEYHLVASPDINAWCMPGGKIVVYTGILPVAKSKAGLATVMGHELAHALLNHGRQDQSAEILKFLGAIGVLLATSQESSDTQDMAMTAYNAGSTLLGTLPFSRKHESEADELGLMLMTIAGYDGEEAVAFWSRMNEQNDSNMIEFLSTHPSDETRVTALKEKISKAKELVDNIK